jgi:hypothetical protein
LQAQTFRSWILIPLKACDGLIPRQKVLPTFYKIHIFRNNSKWEQGRQLNTLRKKKKTKRKKKKKKKE